MAKRRARTQRVVLRYKKKSVLNKRVKKGSIFLVLAVSAVFAAYKVYENAPQLISKINFLKINEIDVLGAGESNKNEDVKRQLSGWKNVSLLAVNKKRIKDELGEKFPELKIVKCGYALPGKLLVNVADRKGVAFTLAGGKEYFVDSEGLLFSASFKADVPEIIYKTEEEKALILDFISVLSRKDVSLPLPVIKITVKYFGEIEFFLSDGTKVSWGTFEPGLDESKDKFSRLNIVLSHALVKFGKLKYVNLRYLDDGRILIRPENKLIKS